MRHPVIASKLRLSLLGVSSALTVLACNLDFEVIPPSGGGAGGSGAGDGAGGACEAARCLADNGPADLCFAWACTANGCEQVPDDSYSEPCYTGPEATREVGVCSDGVATCSGGVLGPCEEEVLPSPEYCGAEDTNDDDCDGNIDCNGNVEWARSLSLVYTPLFIIEEDGLLVVGNTTNPAEEGTLDFGGECAPHVFSERELVLVRFDFDGTCRHLTSLGGSGDNGAPTALARLDADHVALAVTYGGSLPLFGGYTAQGTVDVAIFALTNDYELAWDVTVTGDGGDVIERLAVDDSGLVAAGYTNSTETTINHGGTSSELPNPNGTQDAFLLGFDFEGGARFLRRLQASGDTPNERVRDLESGADVTMLLATDQPLDIGGDLVLTPTVGSLAVITAVDSMGLPIGQAQILDVPNPQALGQLASSPDGARAVGGAIRGSPTSIDCGQFEDVGRSRGFVAELEDDGTCVSRTYTTASEGAVLVTAVGYDRAGALVLAGQHQGTLGGQPAISPLAGFVEKLPDGASGKASWRLWFDPALPAVPFVHVETDANATATYVSVNCGGSIPLFENALPDDDIPCAMGSPGTYLARIGE